MKCLNEESMVFDTMLSLYLSVNGRKLHGEPSRPADHRHDQPTSRHDQPSRPADHRHDQPTTDTTSRPADTERQAQGLQSDASGCKGGKAYASGCKRMQAIKQRGRGKGERGKGQAGANLAKRRKRLKPWRFQRGVFISRGLMRQGSFALLARLPLLAPYAPFPLPLPLCFIGCIPLAFRSHYGFSSPLHSARIRFSCPSPAFLCRLVGWSCRWSAGRVGGRLVG